MSEGLQAGAALQHLEDELDQLRRDDLLRAPAVPLPAGTLVLCSNDYLGLATEPLQPADAASGAGASRLISGDQPEHRALERTLASWLGSDEALLFSSGYAANVGTISALAADRDVIISDELNHASLIDGCRLSRAEVRVVAHRDLDAFERALADSAAARRRWVISESYFSMDGHGPDLATLRALCDAHDAALIVDEAHALGVFGTEGRGLCAEQGVRPDVLVGTLGKAVGIQGAFVAGSRTLRTYLWNRARSFVFSTAASPWLVAATAKRIERIARSDDARARLAAIVARVRARLASIGADLGDSHGPILPWRIGNAAATVAASQRLLEHGVFVQAIRPPTVPAGGSRLRITLHAKLTDSDVERALAAFDALAGMLRSPRPAS